MNILILGCGKTGMALAKEIIQQEHHVTVISRTAQHLENMQHIAQDIRHLSLSKNILFDWVYVILAPDQRSVTAYQSVFIDTAKAVHQALAEHPVQHIVFISSTRVYGENTGQWIDDTTLADTFDPIGQTLIAAERLWSAYWQEKLIIIRPSGLYESDNPYLTRLAHNSENIQQQHWTNRIHRQDLVGFLLYLLSLKNLKPHYLLSDQQPRLQHEIINLIRQNDGLSALFVGKNLPETGKRIHSTHLQQSAYPMKFPIFMHNKKA